MFANDPKSKSVDGGNVCATCPHNCCRDCASRGGWIRHDNPNIPKEIIEFSQVIRKYSEDIHFYYRQGKLTEGEKNLFKNFINENLPDFEKILGYNVEFNLETGFLTKNGCSLKREHRSRTCTNFTCMVLDTAIRQNETHLHHNKIYPKSP